MLDGIDGGGVVICRPFPRPMPITVRSVPVSLPVPRPLPLPPPDVADMTTGVLFHYLRCAFIRITFVSRDQLFVLKEEARDLEIRLFEKDRKDKNWLTRDITLC